MRRTRLVPLALAVFVLGTTTLAACNERSGNSSNKPQPSEKFCKAATIYDEKITRGRPSLDTQIRLVEKIAAAAPADVKADAQTFLGAMRKVKTDSSVRDDPDIKVAVDNVTRRAAQGCGWYKRDSM